MEQTPPGTGRGGPGISQGEGLEALECEVLEGALGSSEGKGPGFPGPLQERDAQ